MGASRQTFNLFNKYGRQNFFGSGFLSDSWGRSHVIYDTLQHPILKLFCKVFGHSKKIYVDPCCHPEEPQCTRCWEYIKESSND